YEYLDALEKYDIVQKSLQSLITTEQKEENIRIIGSNLVDVTCRIRVVQKKLEFSIKKRTFEALSFVKEAVEYDENGDVKNAIENYMKSLKSLHDTLKLRPDAAVTNVIKYRISMYTKRTAYLKALCMSGNIDAVKGNRRAAP
ncbi:hypothetical protein ROZALSC1DRAFT_27524, partial [Rozella allomycis CSF55]